MVIADRAYGSYFLLAALHQRGVDCVIREHQRRKTDLATAVRLTAKDHRLIWDKPQRPRWMDRITYAAIPEQLTVRQVCDRDWRITTTLINSATVKAAEVIGLYRQRWHIELDFRCIKCEMQMDILRCKTPQMVKKEIAAHLLGYNLIRVEYGQTQLWRILGGLGFSPQKPDKRAIERDDDAVRRWKRGTWPALKKGPARRPPDRLHRRIRDQRTLYAGADLGIERSSFSRDGREIMRHCQARRVAALSGRSTGYLMMPQSPQQRQAICCRPSTGAGSV